MPARVRLFARVLAHVIAEGVLRFAVLGAGFTPERERSVLVGVLVGDELGLLVKAGSAGRTNEGLIV